MATKVRGATVEVKCDFCKGTFTARVADRKRGWGRYCTKTCKASDQEKKTGNYAKHEHYKKIGYDEMDIDEQLGDWDDGDSEYWNGKDY